MKTPTRLRKRQTLLPLALLILIGCSPVTPSTTAAATAEVAQPLGSVGGYAEVAHSASPAVASVYSSRTVQAPNVPPQLAPFFGEGGMESHREHGLGSAVIIKSDGYLLTNNHVIEQADEVSLELADGREFDAKVVGTDPKTDIAVLKIDAKDLPTLPIADSDKVEVGDFVLAIGNPFGVGQTVTFGIVSATGRGGLGIEQYEDFIQTDAAINPGNSGGALINTKGQLVGINTAIVAPSGANNGVGFAVPANMAQAIADQILANGRVIRGWLGVSIQPVTQQEAKFFKLESAKGALVGDVTTGSPAEQAGVKRGDVIVALNGQPVQDSRILALRVSSMKPGTRAQIDLIRDGKANQTAVVLGELPEQAEDLSGKPGGEQGALEGISLKPLTSQISRQLGLAPDTRGLVIDDLNSSSPWAEAGLRPGDVIQEVNRKPVATVREFELAAKPSGDSLLLLVNRRGSSSFIVVELK